MFEYKVIIVKVREAEEVMNRMAREGWQVVSTSMMSGESFTVNGAHLIVTMQRMTKL